MDCSTTRFVLVLLLATGLGACASVPPPESQMGKADLALRKAEQADAAHFAPLEMRTARTKLEAARAATSVPVVASGGAGDPSDLAAALQPGRADAALAASIFHRSEYPIPVVKESLAEAGIPMRIVEVA